MAELPLRERKAARLRLGLVDALVERLDERPLEAIPVRELCATVPCAEPTFFNHFAGKTDLLVFFVQLWSLEMAWLARSLDPDDPLGAIEAIFAHTARKTVDHPGVMGEVLAFQARHPDPLDPPPLTRAEKTLAFPEHPGIEDLDGMGLESLLPPLLTAARDRGDLPGDADLDGAFAALATIFLGAPIVGRRVDLRLVEPLYRQQLRWLWRALRHREAP